MENKFLYKNFFIKRNHILSGEARLKLRIRNRHKEKVYLRALAEYLHNKGLKINQEKQIPIYFQNKKVGNYVPDIIVNNIVFIELKRKPFIAQDDIKSFGIT